MRLPRPAVRKVETVGTQKGRKGREVLTTTRFNTTLHITRSRTQILRKTPARARVVIVIIEMATCSLCRCSI